MSRVIKFRAWDSAKNRMGTPWNLEDEMKLPAPIDGHYLDRFPNHVVFMQFTGLLDKNGKEIFEGDVIAVLHGDWSSCSGCHPSVTEHMKSLEELYTVVFADGQFLGKRNTGSYNPWFTDDEGNTYTHLTPDKHGYVEVIGNIYQHPHLLTKSV